MYNYLGWFKRILGICEVTLLAKKVLRIKFDLKGIKVGLLLLILCVYPIHLHVFGTFFGTVCSGCKH